MESPSRRSIVLVVAAIAFAAAAFGYRLWRDDAARRAQEQAARELFAPATDRLASAGTPGRKVDLDTTIRVMHEVDRAVETSASFQEFLGRVAGERYDLVAPDVLQARARILGVLQRLYARQVEQRDREAAWSFSRELLLSGLSVVKVGASPTGGVSFGVDAVQAKRLLDEQRDRRQDQAELVREIASLQGELLSSLLDASTVWAKHLSEWDQLCALRERASLAAHAHDWEGVAKAADAAIELSPTEREAHLLKALALIETERPASDVATPHPAEGLLDSYIAAHPEARAPALTLRGVLLAREGRPDAARRAFEEASAAYPQEVAALGNLQDPLRMRSELLRRTPEGRWILELHRALMLGAGAFSPDLQHARVLFELGETELARRKVLDHFSRRRAQGEWDFIVRDLAVAGQLLGPHLDGMFPEESYLDLVVRQTTFGGKLDVRVQNRSDRALHNATLVVLVRFTDMVLGDDVPFVPPTRPELGPHAITAFGDLDVATPLFGQQKTVADVVSHRAILIADEAVAWVDTAPFKLAALEEARAQPAVEAPADWQRVTGLDVTRVVGLAKEGAAIALESGLLSTDATITLPAALAILKPAFRLRLDGRDLALSTHELRDGQIRLRFEGARALASPPPGAVLDLRLTSRLVALRLAWKADAKGAWTLDSVEPGE